MLGLLTFGLIALLLNWDCNFMDDIKNNDICMLCDIVLPNDGFIRRICANCEKQDLAAIYHGESSELRYRLSEKEKEHNILRSISDEHIAYKLIRYIADSIE